MDTKYDYNYGDKPLSKSDQLEIDKMKNQQKDQDKVLAAIIDHDEAVTSTAGATPDELKTPEELAKGSNLSGNPAPAPDAPKTAPGPTPGSKVEVK